MILGSTIYHYPFCSTVRVILIIFPFCALAVGRKLFENYITSSLFAKRLNLIIPLNSLNIPSNLSAIPKSNSEHYPYHLGFFFGMALSFILHYLLSVIAIFFSLYLFFVFRFMYFVCCRY